MTVVSKYEFDTLKEQVGGQHRTFEAFRMRILEDLERVITRLNRLEGNKFPGMVLTGSDKSDAQQGWETGFMAGYEQAVREMKMMLDTQFKGKE